jgi:hypothetical protein
MLKAVRKGAKMAPKWSTRSAVFQVEPFPLPGDGLRNGPEPSRARRCWGAAKRSLDGEDRSEMIAKRERRSHARRKVALPFWPLCSVPPTASYANICRSSKVVAPTRARPTPTPIGYGSCSPASGLGSGPHKICLEQIDVALILDFLSHIEKQRGNCAATRNGRLAAVKAFIRYVEFRVPSALAQARQIHAIPGKRHDQTLVRHLTLEEVRAILNAPNLTTRLGIRDRAMLHLCFAAGLRVSELVGLPMENLSLQRSPSIRVLGKGRKERCLPVRKETAVDLRAWLVVRGTVSVPELFVNAAGAAMTRAGFEYILDKHVCTATNSCSSLSGRSVSSSSTSTQLRPHYAPGHPGHPQGGPLARAFR